MTTRSIFGSSAPLKNGAPVEFGGETRQLGERHRVVRRDDIAHLLVRPAHGRHATVERHDLRGPLLRVRPADQGEHADDVVLIRGLEVGELRIGVELGAGQLQARLSDEQRAIRRVVRILRDIEREERAADRNANDRISDVARPFDAAHQLGQFRSRFQRADRICER
jgi:hypothetical protein